MRPSRGVGVMAWRKDRKLMKIITAPRPKQVSMKAKNQKPAIAGARLNATQPTPVMAMPSNMQGPGPMRCDRRLPNTLAATVPTPRPTKLSPTSCSDRPSVRVANRICTTTAAW